MNRLLPDTIFAPHCFNFICKWLLHSPYGVPGYTVSIAFCMLRCWSYTNIKFSGQSNVLVICLRHHAHELSFSTSPMLTTSWKICSFIILCCSNKHDSFILALQVCTINHYNRMPTCTKTINRRTYSQICILETLFTVCLQLNNRTWISFLQSIQDNSE